MLVTDSLLFTPLLLHCLPWTPCLDTFLVLFSARRLLKGTQSLACRVRHDLGCFIWALVAFGLGALLAVSGVGLYLIGNGAEQGIPLLAGHPVAPANTPAI